jgi:lantibiotic modifying enzyme
VLVDEIEKELAEYAQAHFLRLEDGWSRSLRSGALAPLLKNTLRQNRHALLPTKVLLAAARRVARRERAANAPFDAELDPHLEFVSALLRRKVELVAESTYGALARLDAMRSEFGDRTDLRLLSPLGQETHNGGERPLLVTFASGRRIVLKPVSAGTGTLVERVEDLLNRELAVPLRPCRVLARDGDAAAYEFAAGRRRLGGQSLKRFYIQAGALLAVAHTLAITDLHFENLIAWGRHPVIVDLETCLYRFPAGLEDFLFERTGLLQPEPAAGRGAESGIQGGGRYHEIAAHIQRRQGHPVLTYRRPMLRSTNRPLAASDVVEPHLYSGFVQAGCEGALKVLRRREVEVLAISRSTADEMPLRTRQLTRFSAFYEMLKLTLFQPLASRDKTTSRARLSDALANDEPALPLAPELLAAEIDDMLAGDTPYFWAEATKFDLRHHSGARQTDVWGETALEQLALRMAEIAAAEEATPRIATLLVQPKDGLSPRTG